jgi:methionyl-tRNA synthetase
MESLHVGDAVNAVMDLAKRCNKYIDETTPWALAKDEAKKSRLNDVLYNLAEALFRIAEMLSPFMPETAEKIAAALGAPLSGEFAASAAPFGAAAGFTVKETAPLFARIDAEKFLKELQEKEAAKKEPETPAAPPCTYDDFCHVELCCAEVLSCERVPKSEKLLKFSLDVGEKEPRTVLSGIAKFYAPEDLVGKKLVLVKNLQPRKMMGFESHGMLLSSEAEGKLRVLTLDPETPAGAPIH